MSRRGNRSCARESNEMGASQPLPCSLDRSNRISFAGFTQGAVRAIAARASQRSRILRLHAD
jgi:hypothetical protein